jgi:hypothetical protein
MTDLITSAPFTIRHPHLPRVTFPKLGIGTTIEALSAGIRQAFCMAYVEPYKTPQRQPLIFIDFDLEGRDPNW